jgi:hypothetical protein
MNPGDFSLGDDGPENMDLKSPSNHNIEELQCRAFAHFFCDVTSYFPRAIPCPNPAGSLRQGSYCKSLNQHGLQFVAERQPGLTPGNGKLLQISAYSAEFHLKVSLT